jgi:hypothetical protein
MEKYEELKKKVMTEDVTLDDWKKFKEAYEQLSKTLNLNKCLSGQKLTEEEVQKFRAMSDEFINAANHVLSKLDEKDIRQDVALTLLYLEKNNS